MIKKTISFKDLDDNDVDEEFYFTLSLSEITLMEVSHSDGLEGHLKKIIASKDGVRIISAMQDMVAMSVGKRSENGRFVEKSPAITQSFMQSGAYEEFFLELVTDADAAAEFIKGIVPTDMAKRVEDASSKKEAPKEYTTAELIALPHEEFVKVTGTNDPLKMSHEHLLIAMQRRNQAIV